MALQTRYHLNIKRLALGTVQFGQNYGVANERGRIVETEIEEILDRAFENEIRILDTAQAYQNSEEIIGNYLLKRNKLFKVVSKLPSFDSYKKGDAEKYLDQSLKNLNQEKIFGYLVHDFESYKRNKDLWVDLISLKEKGKVVKIGFSLYLPQELDELLQQNIDLDIIQIPYSVFDRRFEGYFKELKKRNIEIFVRSVFLQGLAFLKPESLKGNLVKAKKALELLNNISAASGIPISSLCLNHVLSCNAIDHVVIGIDGVDHFKANAKNLSDIDQVKGLNRQLSKLVIINEDVLLPYKWSQ